MNGKIISVETIPGMRGLGNKGECEEGEFQYDTFDIL
jgi:hypothetical protein